MITFWSIIVSLVIGAVMIGLVAWHSDPDLRDWVHRKMKR